MLALERRRLRSGKQTTRMVAPARPAFSSVDPFNKWIDRNSDDNLKEVSKAESLVARSRI